MEITHGSGQGSDVPNEKEDKEESGEGSMEPWVRGAGPASFIGSHGCPHWLYSSGTFLFTEEDSSICTPSEPKQDNDGGEALGRGFWYREFHPGPFLCRVLFPVQPNRRAFW